MADESYGQNSYQNISGKFGQNLDRPLKFQHSHNNWPNQGI